MAEIPIRRNQNQSRPRSKWPKRLLVTAILILIVLNGWAVYFIYHKTKVLAESATNAASNAQTFSGFGQGKSLPAADVAGEDVTGINRYKGSIRTSYQKINNKTTIEYQTKDTAQAVLTFFKTQLASDSWILEEARSDSITFLKNNSLITISVSENKNDKITTIKIVY